VIARLWHGMTRVEHYDAYWSFLRAFAGDEVDRAKYYPEDRNYLLEFEPTVLHYDVTGTPE